MARIAGVDLPKQKPIKVALTSIYGIGRAKAASILESIKLDPNTRVDKLTPPQIQQLTQVLNTFPVEGDLRKKIHDNIQRLTRISSYRGLRHRQGLPTRGQNTRTNARSRRGKRRTVGAMTKEMRQKLDTQA